MNDYPDIEREVPAWAFEPGDQPRILEYDDLNDLPPRLRPWFLRGLAQFVRAIQKPLEERVALLEHEVAELEAQDLQRELDRPEEKPQDGLAERLAKAASVSLYRFIDENPDCPIDGLVEVILPDFQRAVRGEG